MARFQFAVRMALARLRSTRKVCPYCGSCLYHRLQRKWFLIEARKCAFCGLIFRYPNDEAGEAHHYYENGYDGRTVVQMPDAARLQGMIDSAFRGTPFDKSARVNLLRELVTTGPVLDFGCSWGYAVLQLRNAGLDAAGFETAQGRAEYGRKHLGVSIETEWERLLAQSSQRLDAIYADHVLEHVPNLRMILEGFARLLRPGGRVVIFVPNCGGQQAREKGVGWGPFIGESHTIAFTAEWFHQNLARHGFQIEALGSSPHRIETLPDSEELLCIARRLEPSSNGKHE